MFGKNRVEMQQVFEQMKESLTTAVMQSVGQKLLNMQKIQQDQLKDQLDIKIENFNQTLEKTVREVIEREFMVAVRSIVKEEIGK
jgi:hypothetical protein